MSRRRLRELRLAGEERRKPFRGRPGKRLIGEIRPFVLSGGAQETNPVAELGLRLAPRQAAKSELRDAFRQKTRRFFARRQSPGLICKQNGIEPADPARPQRTRAWIEIDFVRLADATARGG